MRAELHSLIINSLFHSVISVHFPLRRADLGLKERSSLDEYRMIRKHGGVIKIEINSLNRGSVNDNQPYSGDRTIPFLVSLFLYVEKLFDGIFRRRAVSFIFRKE